MSNLETPEKIPVILDTDIGTDIDDTWALAMILKSPELDIKLIVSDTHDTPYRAKIVAKFLEAAGRTDIPVGVGIQSPDRHNNQEGWVKGYSLEKYPGTVYDDGVQAIIDTINASETRVDLICIGPVPNIAAALERDPSIANKARFVGMHGSVRVGYSRSTDISAEYNVKADALSCRKAFQAPWEKIITPLDTCGIVVLDGERYQKIRHSEDPALKALIENYRCWLEYCHQEHKRDLNNLEIKSSVIFDTVAVYLSFSEKFLKVETLNIYVTDDGFTRIDDELGNPVKCATEWTDLEAFYDFLTERLLAPTQPAPVN